MGQKVFRIKSFDGGLVTSRQESGLRPNESPNLVNFDILDSGVLRTRKGYSAMLGTAPTTTAKLYRRFYKSDGTVHHLVLGATNVWSIQLGAKTAGQKTSYLDALCTSGSEHLAWITDDNPWHPLTLACTGTATLSIPYSSKVVFTPQQAASIQVNIDGAGWVNRYGTSWTETLTATTHSIQVRPTARQNASISKQGIRATSYGTFPAVNVDEFSFWWMDTSSYTIGTTRQYMKWSFAGGKSIIIKMAQSGTDHYWYIDGGYIQFSGTPLYWYKFQLKQHVDPDGRINYELYFGGTILWSLYTGGNLTGFEFNCQNASGVDQCHFDEFDFNYCSWDDGDDQTLWEQTGYDCNKGTTYYHTGNRQFVLNAATYSATAEVTRKAGGLTASEPLAFATHLWDNIYYVTPVNTMKKFDGATCATVYQGTGTATPLNGCIALTSGKNRLWAVGASDPTKVIYSQLGNDKWLYGTGASSSGSFPIGGANTGVKGTGLAFWDNYLFAFTHSQTWAASVDGTPTGWAQKLLSDSHGCVAPRSLVSTPMGIVFLSADGVRCWGKMENIYSDDGSGLMLLSDNITPTLERITPEVRSLCFGGFYKNKYWLVIAVDGSYSFNTVLVCDLEKRNDGQPVWTTYQLYHGIYSLWVDSVGEYALYAVRQTTNGQVFRMDDGKTDWGQPVGVLWESPPLFLDSPGASKHWRTVNIAGYSPYPAAFSLVPETDDVSGISSVVSFDATTPYRPSRASIAARGRYLKMTISGSPADTTDINSMEITYLQEKMK